MEKNNLFQNIISFFSKKLWLRELYFASILAALLWSANNNSNEYNNPNTYPTGVYDPDDRASFGFGDDWFVHDNKHRWLFDQHNSSGISQSPVMLSLPILEFSINTWVHKFDTWPVDWDVIIISDINEHRSHWYHQGVDILAPERTEVKNPKSWKVLKISWDGCGAKCITIKYDWDIIVKYMHIKPSLWLSEGSDVTPGQVIGFVVKLPKGNNTQVDPRSPKDWVKDHLHVEVTNSNGENKDPKNYFPSPDYIPISNYNKKKLHNNSDNLEQQNTFVIGLDNTVETESYIRDLISLNSEVFTSPRLKDLATQYLLSINQNVRSNSINVGYLSSIITFDIDWFLDAIAEVESEWSGDYKADNYPTFRDNILKGKLVVVKDQFTKSEKNKNREKWDPRYIIHSDQYTKTAIGRYQMIASFIIQYGKWLWPNWTDLDILQYPQDVDLDNMSESEKIKNAIGFNDDHRNYILGNTAIQDEMATRAVIEALETIYYKYPVKKLNNGDLVMYVAFRRISGLNTMKKFIKSSNTWPGFLLPSKLSLNTDRLGTSLGEYVEDVCHAFEERERNSKK